MLYETGEHVTAFAGSDDSVDLEITGLDEQTGVANTAVDADGNVYVYMDNDNDYKRIY